MKFKQLFILLSVLTFISCDIFRPVVNGLPKEKDDIKNPFRPISNNSGKIPFYFNRSNDTLPQIKKILIENKGLDATAVSLNEFVKLHKTISFVIIRNDSILYEYYRPDYSAEINVTSFSVSKSFVTMLIGIAIQEGKIKSVNEPVTEIIPELKDRGGFENITIKNLLQHTSGIKFTKQILNPWSDQSEFYYATDLRKRILDVKVNEPPGMHFDYQSENTMLLALILERSTKMPVSKYLEEKIWSQIDTEAPATWNTDRSDSLAIERAFCCINARTLDFAKFGRLLLNYGNWNGKQIIPQKWMEDATRSSFSEGGKVTYGYNLGIGPAQYKSFFPIGLYGQFIYVYPARNLLIIRFGDRDINYNPNYWKNIMLQIIDELG
ncbi:MAG: serine hydrolase domain-containing protein [Paludibacteraceae bacterium]